MIPDTPEQLHHKEASELQSNVSDTDSGGHRTLILPKTLMWVSDVQHSNSTPSESTVAFFYTVASSM